jgi:LysM repeat protein
MLFTKVLSLVILASLSSAYTIQSGDTYCLIAQKYGCSDWTVLQKANGYGVYSLPVGGRMTIPSTCTGYQTCYNAQVQPGDSYTSIAARYNVDPTCLANTNCNGGLSAYGTVCIPTNCGYSAQTPAPATQAPSQSGYANYVIQSGDTYCQIAQKYGCSDWTVWQYLDITQLKKILIDSNALSTWLLLVCGWIRSNNFSLRLGQIRAIFVEGDFF